MLCGYFPLFEQLFSFLFVIKNHFPLFEQLFSFLFVIKNLGFGSAKSVFLSGYNLHSFPMAIFLEG